MEKHTEEMSGMKRPKRERERERDTVLSPFARLSSPLLSMKTNE